MQNLRALACERRQPWRAAVLDPDARFRARLIDVARAAGITVSVSAVPRPEVARLITQTGCDVTLLGMETPEPEPLALAAGLECPVVLCSGEASPSIIESAQRVRAMAFLVRPFRPDQLAPTITLAVARFREQRLLRRALEERKLIERAKGRLMAVDGLTEDDAFRWLRQRAMNTRSRMADVARQVLGNFVNRTGATRWAR